MANIKTEFIYINEATDPVMEFGLKSKYPMRPLYAHCSDMKEYLEALKKAVSRNNLIIVLGGFGDNAETADITGRAVGRRIIKYDYSALSLSSISAPVYLPEGCLPLFDNNSRFCGILMESGPQAIFLIDESAPDRTYVMKELIAPYVNEFFETVIKGDKD